MIDLLISTFAMMGLTFLIGFFVAAVIKLIAYAADSFDFFCYHRSDRQSKLLWLLNKYLAGFSAGQQCFAEKLFHFFRNSLEIYSGSL